MNNNLLTPSSPPAAGSGRPTLLSRTWRGCGYLEGYGEHPGTALLIVLVLMGSADTNAAKNILGRSTALQLVEEPGCGSDEARTLEVAA